jgi:uncharacterized protein YjbJ (UPF0337 family)
MWARYGGSAIDRRFRLVPWRRAFVGGTPVSGRNQVIRRCRSCIERAEPSVAIVLPAFGIDLAPSPPRRASMNWDQIEGNWKQLKGKAREQWGKLTDDELDTLAGKREQLVGKVQERYGYERDRAEREVDDVIRRW